MNLCLWGSMPVEGLEFPSAVVCSSVVQVRICCVICLLSTNILKHDTGTHNEDVNPHFFRYPSILVTNKVN